MITLAQLFAESRANLPTGLGSADLRKLDLQLRQSSLFSARMTNAQAVQGVREALQAILSGADNTAEARYKLKLLGQSLGYDPAKGFPDSQPSTLNQIPPAEAGEIRDLFSTDRLNLILNTQRALVDGYALKQHGNTDMARFQFPCWELVRVFDVETPRGSRRGPKNTLIPVPGDDWPSRWIAAGGELVDGDRMIAPKGDPIWEALGEGVGGYDDSLDNGGAPPFALNSGKGWREVPRDEAIALGIIDPDETPDPADSDFGPKEVAIDGKKYDTDILKELERSLLAGALAPGVKISFS
jgi:hypothetical protein